MHTQTPYNNLAFSSPILINISSSSSFGGPWNTIDSETTNSRERSRRCSLHLLRRGRSGGNIHFPSSETRENEEAAGHRDGTCCSRDSMDEESDRGEAELSKRAERSRTVADARGEDRETKIDCRRGGQQWRKYLGVRTSGRQCLGVATRTFNFGKHPGRRRIWESRQGANKYWKTRYSLRRSREDAER